MTSVPELIKHFYSGYFESWMRNTTVKEFIMSITVCLPVYAAITQNSDFKIKRYHQKNPMSRQTLGAYIGMCLISLQKAELRTQSVI